jgi:hypothetical protein
MVASSRNFWSVVISIAMSLRVVSLKKVFVATGPATLSAATVRARITMLAETEIGEDYFVELALGTDPSVV